MFVNRKPKGRINHPGNHTSVPRLFRAEGTVEGLPAGQHLLLVVEVGGWMWPKGQVLVNNGSWASEVSEEGTPPNGDFTLSLYAVSDKGYDAIAAWLERGRLTGDYPGLAQIKGGIRLHSVRLRLSRQAQRPEER
jgi:hypothetical protein